MAKKMIEVPAENAWTPKRAPRVFPIDIFLSHNANDGSERIARQLEEQGVITWHDENSNLADRRVIERISKALHDARLIAVCVTENYRDSLWVRAEYIPTLRRAESINVFRVVVLEIDEGAAVPEELAKCPVFDIFNDGIEKLVAVAKVSNYLEIPDFAALDDVRALTSAASLNRMHETTKNSLIEGLLSVTNTLEELNTESEAYQAACLQLIQINDLLCSTLDELDGTACNHVVQLALRLSKFSDIDVRANATMLIASLVEHKRCSIEVLMAVLYCEQSRHVINLALPVLVSYWKEANNKHCIRKIALVAPEEVNQYQQLLADCPDVVKAFVSGRIGLDFESLSVDEQCKWLFERLVFLLNAGRYTVDRDEVTLGELALGISEFEIIFRETKTLLDRLLYQDSTADLQVLSSTYVKMAKLMVSNKTSEKYIASLGDWLFDFFFVPLLFLYETRTYRKEASELYERGCELLRGSSLEPEVHIYRKAFEKVSCGKKHWNDMDFLL